MNKHVIILIDTSYSMQSFNLKIIKGLNDFINNLKSNMTDDNIFLSIISFNNITRYLYKLNPIENSFDKISDELFIDSGVTNLYDAIGTVINDWIDIKKFKHLLYIITDGDDNFSVNYTKESIEKYCKFLIEINDWEITHCDINLSNLSYENIKKIKYDINSIDKMLENLSFNIN
jgi:uncharacterized protein YegL